MIWHFFLQNESIFKEWNIDAMTFRLFRNKKQPTMRLAYFLRVFFTIVDLLLTA